MSRNEKSKSIFGNLPTLGKRKGSQKHNGTARPVSTNDSPVIDDLGIDILVKRMTIEEVNNNFRKLVEDSNIPADKRPAMFQMSLDEKRVMLKMQIKKDQGAQQKSKSENKEKRFENPQDYIDYLRDPDRSPSKVHQCVESLRVALTNNSLTWLKEFGESGLDEVVNLLRESKRRRDFDKIEYECIRCIKAFANNTWGLNVIIKPDQHAAVFLLAQCLDPNKAHMMAESTKLLAAFCLVQERDGYNKVLNAITQAAKMSGNSGERFRSIVEGIFLEHDQELKGIKAETKGELCLNSLVLINTITNQPENLDFRLHLRCEIMRSGLYDRLDLLTKIVEQSNNDKLEGQLKIFNTYREEDFEILSERFDHVRMELDDMNDCFELLKNLVLDTASEPYFLSILQHMLFVRDDHEFRVAYFKLFEEVISQIVMNKSGVDPNFNSRQLNFDIEPLLEDLVEHGRAIDAKKIEEYEKKMEELQMAKQEAEAKAAHLEEKLKEIEATGVVTKKNNLPQINIPPPPAMPGMPMAPRPPPPPPGGMSNGPIPPPPPPPGMGGIPRPPAPPPMPGMGGPPPPPMMGMMRPPGMPMQPAKPAVPEYLKEIDIHPTNGPMKRANWKPVAPQKIEEKSFWALINKKLARKSPTNDERNSNRRSSDLDPIISDLANKFTTKPVKKPIERDAIDKPMTTKKSVVELRVLDGKAAQNLSILLGGSLKHLSYDEIKLYLLRCDMQYLNATILQQLIQYLPPPDQLKRLQELKASGQELSGAEKFAATIAEIKRLGARLQSLSFRLNFPDMYEEIRPDIYSVINACKDVQESKKFHKILELILLLGNHMNYGAKNELVYGFEISFLTKLTSTKDYENKQTLLHYIAEVVAKKYPECLNFYEELSHIDKASRVSVDNIQKTMRQMNSSLKNLEADLNNNKVPQSPDDKFIEVMGEFTRDTKSKIEVLAKRQADMEKNFNELAKFYAFDINKYSLEEFFNDIKTFKDAFIQAHQDNVKIREAEEREKRAREARELQLQQKQMKEADSKKFVDMNQQQDNVVDSLFEALQSGSAFLQPNRERRKRQGGRPAGAERRAQLSRSRSRTGITAANLSSRELLANELLAA